MAIPFIASEERRLLRDGLRRWGAARDVRSAEDFAETWRFAAGQGWLMAGLPEAAGGLGGDAFDMAVIAEEWGRALLRAPLVEAMVAARVLLAAAPEALGPVIAGDAIMLLAHDEPAARGDPLWVETRAREGHGGWRLTGRKTAIVGAGHADRLLVSARLPGGALALFALDAAEAPLKSFTTIDDRSGGELRLDDTPATLLAAKAQPALREAFDHGLMLEAAEAVGAMERAFELTRDYLLTRRQYGQYLAEFQALRHRIADMFIELEQARSIVLRGLEALGVDAGGRAGGGDADRRAALASAVKARVAQAGMFVCGQAIQLHGGIGVTDEYPVGHFFKRMLAFDLRHGGGAAQVARFAALGGATGRQSCGTLVARSPPCP